jgi:hypothetical protein
MATTKKKPIKKDTPKNKGGRATKYHESYPDLVYKLCLLGLTDEELAISFSVHVDTIYEWKKKHPEFSEACASGKQKADAEVAAKLHRKATGYIEKRTRIVKGQKIEVEFEIPADTQAATWWLKNRQPTKWRDKVEVESSGEIGLNLNVQFVGTDDDATK